MCDKHNVVQESLLDIQYNNCFNNTCDCDYTIERLKTQDTIKLVFLYV